MKNLMLDLETLGRKPGCGITEIGWCCFSSTEYKVSAAFGHLIPIEQSLLYGLESDPDTIRWWLEEQKGFPVLVGERAHITLPQVLSDVASQWNELWFAGVQLLWSKPSLFDIPILNAAYDMLKVERPIILRAENFWRWRDLITLKQLPKFNPQWGDTLVEDLKPTAHRAKEDALAQAHQASKLFSVHNAAIKDARSFPTAAKDVQMWNDMYLRERNNNKKLETSLTRIRGRKQSKSKSRKR